MKEGKKECFHTLNDDVASKKADFALLSDTETDSRIMTILHRRCTSELHKDDSESNWK